MARNAVGDVQLLQEHEHGRMERGRRVLATPQLAHVVVLETSHAHAVVAHRHDGAEHARQPLRVQDRQFLQGVLGHVLTEGLLRVTSQPPQQRGLSHRTSAHYHQLEVVALHLLVVVQQQDGRLERVDGWPARSIAPIGLPAESAQVLPIQVQLGERWLVGESCW
jgi:hypothetical protein